ncbi:MAG: glycosyltransferase family A protein [Acidimicrobiia bacterium]|nr:glycosyltransferase family A protein [Acidimicrobiia bacterium]
MPLAVPENDYRAVAGAPSGAPRSVTAVVPARDRPEALRRTLAGLAAQRGHPDGLLSVVVVDEGSTIDLAAVVAPHMGSLDIALVRSDGGAPLDVGAGHATGEVLLLLAQGAIPDPGLVAAHDAWHRRRRDVVVAGARHPLDAAVVERGDPAAESNELRRLAGVEDERMPSGIRTFVRRTGVLRHGVEGFRLVSAAHVSMETATFGEVGGYPAAAPPLDAADLDLGYRIAVSGRLVVPEPGARTYHPGHRGMLPGREADAGDRVPLPLFRPPGVAGSVPKLSVVTAGRPDAGWLADIHDAVPDAELWLPLGGGLRGARTLPDAAGDEPTRVLRAVAAATGDLVAVTAGDVGAVDVVRGALELDAMPRIGRVVDGPSTGPAGLPALVVARRRDWNRAAGADLGEAWRTLCSITRAVPLPDALSVPRPGPLTRLARRLRSRRIPVRHVGDDRALAQVRAWAGTWAEPTDDRTARAILLVGATLDRTTWEEVVRFDHPRRERIAVGVRAGDGPVDEWVDFLETCVAVGAETVADADALTSWGVTDVLVTGHPDDSAEALGLLDAVAATLR